MGTSTGQDGHAVDGLSVAQVDIISFKAIRDGNGPESRRLFEACCEHGFFYLDMSSAVPNIQRAIDNIYTLEKELFALSEEQLRDYDIDVLSPKKKLNGRDGFQSYALPKDGILRIGNQGNFPRPQLIDTYMASLQTFALAISKAASVVFLALSKSLGLSPASNLDNVHSTHRSSPDLIRLLRYHAQPPSERGSSHIPHTDLGSLTFLFTKQPGLQILDPKSRDWKWVQPKEGCATVNIGDCMSLLTNGLFRSSQHRVVALPGQAMKERYSFAYFMRPDEETLMRPVTSPVIPVAECKDGKTEEVFTSGEWLQRKFAMLRRDTWTEDRNWILTGT
ncbi:MAG: hypothetical protein Q9166_008233 [cf. Caloplaca sp. 2 TL-2023]